MVITLMMKLLKFIWKVIRGLTWLTLWGVALAMLLWYPMRWWPGDQLRLVRMLNYFMPWLLVGLTPALLMAAIARRTRLALVLAIPTTLIALNFAPLFLPRMDVALAGQTQLKVMSYNVLYRNQNLVEAMEIIRQEQPDILLLQEVTPTIAETLHSLDNLYSTGITFYAYEPSIGQTIISRYPIHIIDINYENRTQKAQIDTPDGLINVWNVHPIAPYQHWQLHYQQLSTLADEIGTVDGPLIVGGDFNTPYQSEAYRLIDHRLTNTHWEAGWSFGFTFPAQKPRFRGVPIITPVIRIDHIFHNDHFFTHNAHTLSTSGGSDHIPIVAVVSLVK